MQSIISNLEMAENRLPTEKTLSPSAFPPHICVFLIYNKKKDPLSITKPLGCTCSRKKKTGKKTDCKSPSQYQNTIVFHVIINNNPPGSVSLQTFSQASADSCVTRCNKAHNVTYLDEQREVLGREGRKKKREEKIGGGSGVKEECNIMYSGFVQVTVGSNAAVTHLKLALACPQRRTEVLQALTNPYSPDTCSAWRIHRY